MLTLCGELESPITTNMRVNRHLAAFHTDLNQVSTGLGKGCSSVGRKYEEAPGFDSLGRNKQSTERMPGTSALMLRRQRQKRSEVQGCPQLHSKFEPSVGYMKLFPRIKQLDTFNVVSMGPALQPPRVLSLQIR